MSGATAINVYGQSRTRDLPRPIVHRGQDRSISELTTFDGPNDAKYSVAISGNNVDQAAYSNSVQNIAENL
jgi:hypothetical protein